MIKKLICFLLFAQTGFVFAGDSNSLKCIGDSYHVVSRKPDKSLKPKGTRVLFTFKNQSGSIVTDEICVSWKEDSLKLHPNKNGNTNMLLTAGTYKFNFRVKEYRVLKTDTILLKRQQCTEISVYLETTLPINCDKPVIYVYAPQTMAVSIQLDIKGETKFTYPAYNTGWNFSTDPNGTIHMNGNEYNYLFWESASTLQNENIDYAKGFVVDSKKLVSFLENNLEKMGFNSKETADFITYWCPRMMQNETNYIHFIFNDECNVYAGLTVSPKPENMLRVYMLWAPVENGNKAVLEQELPKLNRQGLTVLEWGGIEMSRSEKVSSN